MPYSRYAKSNGSIRLVLDRMSLVIGVICFVLSLMLTFAGGYLVGFNSRVPVATSPPQPQANTLTVPAEEPAPPPSPQPSIDPLTAASASVAPPSLSDLYWRLAATGGVETTPLEGDADTLDEALSDEGRADASGQDEPNPAPYREQAPSPEPIPEPPAPERRSTEDRPAQGGYTVQVGAYRVKDNADRMLARVQALGYEAEQVYTWYDPEDPVYCVWVGRYANLYGAAAAAALYREREGEDAVAVPRIIRR